MAILPPLPEALVRGDDAPSPPLGAMARTNGPDLARDRKDTQDEIWYHPEEVDGIRWDQSYPYQLLVLDRQADGTYRRRGEWRYTLPVPPEAMTITTPYAIQTTVTQGGIVEEHNAAPLRQIELSGSFGVLPTRPSGGQRRRPDLASAVFAGTIRAVRRTAAALQDAVADLTGDARRPANLIPRELLVDPRSPDTLLRDTGYYQTHVMAWFIEAYANLKRSPAGHAVHLAFANWKDQAVYLVTPNTVRIRKAADSPLEYRYQLLMTAWARVRLDGPGPVGSAAVPDPAAPNVLAQTLNALQDARRTLQDARQTVGAVVADVDRAVFEPLREAILLTKDALGVPLALIDLPAAIVRDTADTVVAAVAAGQDVAGFGDDLGRAKTASKRSIQADLQRIKEVLAPGVRDRTTVATGLGALTVRPEAIGGGPRRPGLDLFDRPEEHPDLMGALRPDRLSLPASVTARIAAETARVRALSEDALRDRRGGLREARATFEDAVGAGDPTVAATYGRLPPRPARPLTPRLLRALGGLQAVAVAYDGLVARAPRTADAAARRALEAYAGHAAASGVPFRVPTSKFPAPLPYGTTIEQLALRYLGSADRVSEIIALNGLRAPYVDEVGVALPLLAPGVGRDVVVADSPALPGGQTAGVESAPRPPARRRVQGVARRNGQAIVTLDGDADLAGYSPVERAALHVFLPGTVNSQMMVWIPSAEPPEGTFRPAGIAAAARYDALASAGGVDLLLTPTNDLVVTPDGDGRWAVGLTNITQLFRILMTLRRGQLLHHPTRGLPLGPGTSVADTSPGEVVRAIRETLAPEPAFGIVRSISVVTRPPTVDVRVAVEVGGGAVVVPLSVEGVR